MNKKQARIEANSRVVMSRSAEGWVLSEYDMRMNCWDESVPIHYSWARELKKLAIERIISEILGDKG